MLVLRHAQGGGDGGRRMVGGLIGRRIWDGGRREKLEKLSTKFNLNMNERFSFPPTASLVYLPGVTVPFILFLKIDEIFVSDWKADFPVTCPSNS